MNAALNSMKTIHLDVIYIHMYTYPHFMPPIALRIDIKNGDR